MKRFYFPIIGIVTALFLMTIGGVDNVARGQSSLPPPTSISVTDGTKTGEVVVTWAAVEGAAFYRVGWMANEDYLAAGGADAPHWAEEFRYSDIGNREQNRPDCNPTHAGYRLLVYRWEQRQSLR